MTLEAIRYKRGSLNVLDQLGLPHQEEYLRIATPQDAWTAIHTMQVRGAPAIAIVAALSLAVYLSTSENCAISGNSSVDVARFISNSLKFLVTSRPTAVNLYTAARRLESATFRARDESDSTAYSVREAYISAAEQMLVHDVQDNKSIGAHGASWIIKNCAAAKDKISVLTHCNTGSLATAGYGTALGVVRSLQEKHVLRKAFYTETRPYNQGVRLTGYELQHDAIPSELITDSMAATLLQLRKASDNIVAVVVGADRVAANGDTANKIGTYQLAIMARHHGIKFLVAAPRTTIDQTTPSGDCIQIEQRPTREVTMLKGVQVDRVDGKLSYGPPREIMIAPHATNAWNPSFDVTPAELIDGIVTEVGVVEKTMEGSFDFVPIFNKGIGEVEADRVDEEQDDARSIPWSQVICLKSEDSRPWSTWVEAGPST